MNLDPGHAMVALAVGFLAGGLFFLGLWWTVRLIPTARHAGLIVFTSFVLRTALVLAAFYLVGAGHPLLMLLSLAGFLLARLFCQWWTGRSASAKTLRSNERSRDAA